MFPMRLKIGPARNNEWRCFFCLHVRTATILLGVWHLILHVLALSILALVMRNYHFIMQQEANTEVDPSNLLPTPLSKVKDNDNPYALPTTQDGRAIYPSDVDMGALVTICTLAITLLLVYGTVKGKATQLLPFFCLQLFDFAITVLTATGYFCYLQSVHQFVNESWRNMPYRKELLQLSPQSLSLLVLASFLISMLWKAYCISVVWRCYKFLTIRQQTMRSTVHYIVPEGNERVPEPDYSSLLPDYEAACASVMKQPPPPSYQAAMEGQQPPAYPEAVHVVNITPTTRYGFIVTQNTTETPVNSEVPVTVIIPQNDTATNAETTENNEAENEAGSVPNDDKENQVDELKKPEENDKQKDENIPKTD